MLGTAPPPPPTPHPLDFLSNEINEMKSATKKLGTLI